MKKFIVICGLAVAAALGIISHSSKTVVAQNAAREILPLQLEEQIPVPSVAGRIDHFSADAKRRRLFVSALGNNSLEVSTCSPAKSFTALRDSPNRKERCMCRP